MSDSRSVSPTEVDFSVIRTSIDMGHSMLDQILNGIHYGSDEIRAMLREECDFILECKVCRNMFRSFANFVAHKRVYCKESIVEFREKGSVSFTETETIVVQPKPPEESQENSLSMKSNVDRAELRLDHQKANADSVIDQVVKKTYRGNSKEYQFYTKVAEKMVHAKAGKITDTVTLKTIPATTKAMIVNFNHMGSDINNVNNTDIISEHLCANASSGDTASSNIANAQKKKSSLTDVCSNLMHKQSAPGKDTRNGKGAAPALLATLSDRTRKSVPQKLSSNNNASSIKSGLGNKTATDVDDDDVAEWTCSSKHKQSHSSKQNSPEKMETSPVTDKSDKPWIKLCDLEKLLCLECGRKFKCGDGLKQHAKMIHCGFRTVSRCPLCQKEFSYFNSVARHIRNVHKKSEKQIDEYRRKMNARSKCVERISPENLAKMMSTSSGSSSASSLSNSSGYKQCKRCQKYFSNKKRFRQHTSRCTAKVKTPNKLSNPQQAKKTETTNDDTTEVQSAKEPDHVYKERELDKPSVLYKALTSPSGGKPPTVVYVYPKSPVHQDDSIKSKISKKATDKNSSSTCKEKQKHDSYKDKGSDNKTTPPLPDTVGHLQHTRESRSGSSDSGKDRQGLRSSSSETLTDKSVLSVRETRSSTNDTSHKRESRSSSNEHKRELGPSIDLGKEKRDLRNSSIESSSFRENLPKTRAAHVKQDDLKIVELKKLKERLMIEATGKSPNKLDNVDGATIETKQRRPLDEAGSEAVQRTQLKISIGQESEKNEEKSQDTIDSDTLRSSNLSPVVKSPTSPISCPISPASINSNSADGYSHKFKMTAKEMADLVVTASLTKFAKERKKRAQDILNKKSSKEGLGAMLTQPMKRGIRGSQIIPKLPKKMYSTRLASGSKLTGTSRNEMVDRSRDQRAVGLVEQRLLDNARPGSLDKTVGEIHGKDKTFDFKNKRLSRELRQLENTAGFNEKRYYASHTGIDASKEVDLQTNPAKEITENQSRDIGQETAVNVLMQKLITAQESVNNSQSFIDKKSPVKEYNSGNIDERSNASEGTKKSSRLSRFSAHEESRKTAMSVISAADVNKDMKKKLIHSRSSSASSEAKTIEGDSRHRSRSSQGNIAMDSVTTSSRDSSSERLGFSQSKRLSRQLKMLENSIGFNEKGYYDAHSDSSSSNDPKSKESSQLFRPSKIQDNVRDLAAQNNPATPSKIRDDKTRNVAAKISTATDQKETPDDQDKTIIPVQIINLISEDEKLCRTRLSSGSISNNSDMIINREPGDDLEGKGRCISVTKGADKLKVKNVDVESGNQSVAADGKQPVVTNSDIALDKSSPIIMKSAIALDKNVKGTADEAYVKDVNERKVTGYKSKGDSSVDGREISGKVTVHKPKDIDIYDNEGGSTNGPATHRTRLSTGSLVFDSELLRTNPSKQDSAGKRVPADGSKTETSGIRLTSPKKRLLSSPEKMVEQSNKSEQKKYTYSLLATGIIQCEECKRHFWKIRSYKSHFKGRCKKTGEEKSQEVLEVRKKRPLSLSPRKVGGSMSDDGHDRMRKDCKKPRLIGMSALKDRRIGSEDQPIDTVAKRHRTFTEGETSPTKQSKQKSKEEMEQDELLSTDSRIIVQSTSDLDLGLNTDSILGISDKAGTSTSYVNDSDGDSEFSGFSETDLTEQERNIEVDFQCDKQGVKNNLEGDIDDDLDSIADGQEIKDTDKTFSSDNLVKKGRLRRRQNVDPWAKKRSYSTPFRSFVCDTKRPRKMVCQATKNIDKMIDTEKLVCKYCDSKHSSVSNLRQHAIRHLGWMRYKCKMCLYTGYNLSEVKLHLSRSHSIKSSSLEMSSYVIDLKTEARNIRISKRSKTLREHRAKGITSQSSSDIYAKPRPNISATRTKAGRIIVKRQVGRDVESSSKNRVENNNQTPKTSMDATVLNKARQRLSNVLNP